MQIVRNTHEEEWKSLKALQIPPSYLYKDGVLDPINWTFRKQPPFRGDPKSTIMRFRIQCVMQGCEKLFWAMKVDINDYEHFAKSNPFLKPEEVEGYMLDSYKQNFGYLLLEKQKVIHQKKTNHKLINKLGAKRLPNVTGRKKIW